MNLKMTTAAKAQISKKILNLFVVPRRDLAVEFANTLMWRGSAPAESLHTAADVAAWLSANKTMPVNALDALTGWFDGHPAHADAFLRESIEIREAIYRLIHGIAASSASDPADLRQLNDALRASPPRGLLERADGNYGWRIEAKPVAAEILAPVLWSAADVLVGPDSARVRECANHRCLWLFLDDSKNGSRRWCSMQMCGNRAKAQRHYQRQKDR
jgi:predicted RNA-binding Zn ribbon-like protein